MKTFCIFPTQDTKVVDNGFIPRDAADFHDRIDMTNSKNFGSKKKIWELYIVKDKHDSKSKFMKLLRYNRKGQDFCEIILSKWMVLQHLGIINDGIIYNTYDKDNMKHCFIALVQKEWTSDVETYLKDYNDFDLQHHGWHARDCIAEFMYKTVPQLKKIHDFKIIHGDIKTANICMDYDKDKNKSIDFNAGLIDFDLVIETDKYSKSIFGTKGYMAPEIREGQMFKVTTKMDIYSFGITILELITGSHPYRIIFRQSKYGYRALEYDYIQKYLSENKSSLEYYVDEAYPRGAPEELKDLIKKMIKYDVDERYDIDDVIAHKWYQDNCLMYDKKAQKYKDLLSCTYKLTDWAIL